MSDDDLIPVGNSLLKSIPIMEFMGIEVAELRPGLAVATVPFRDSNGNHIGTMYAGALFTVAEVLGGLVSFASFDVAKYYPVIKGLDIRFRRPVRTDATAKCEISSEQVAAIAAEAERNGKSEFVLNAEISDTSGEQTATSSATYQIRRHGM